MKLTGGLRWTDDRKSFDEIPSWTLVARRGLSGHGHSSIRNGKKCTGRFNVYLDAQARFHRSIPVLCFLCAWLQRRRRQSARRDPDRRTFGIDLTSPSNQTHPLTFKPEFNDAFELGTKNSLLDGAMTLNGDVFFYKYQNYQISQIVDRTSVNLNFNATVRGAEAGSDMGARAGPALQLRGRL